MLQIERNSWRYILGVYLNSTMSQDFALWAIMTLLTNGNWHTEVTELIVPRTNTAEHGAKFGLRKEQFS